MREQCKDKTAWVGFRVLELWDGMLFEVCLHQAPSIAGVVGWLWISHGGQERAWLQLGMHVVPTAVLQQ